MRPLKGTKHACLLSADINPILHSTYYGYAGETMRLVFLRNENGFRRFACKP